jgi:hypothetical protein
VVFEAHADGRLGHETDGANEGAQDDVLTHAITRQQAVEAVYEAVNEAKGSAPALAGQQIDEVTLSHTRQATPSRSSGAPRTDGLCIFKTPKKARFAAAHVASTVTASTSSR